MISQLPFEWVKGLGGDHLLTVNIIDLQIFNPKKVDQVIEISEEEARIMTKRLAKEEGLFCGTTSGMAMQAVMQMKDKLTADDFVVVILHDHGSRYVGKVYNDEWMKEKGFL